MSRRRRKKQAEGSVDAGPLKAAVDAGGSPSGADKRATLVIGVVLAGLGVYLAIVYWGHSAMPHADAPYFPQVGHELLSFQVPSSFKRAPVYGLMQAMVSYVVGGSHPDLTAGMVLNSVMYPCIGLLVWLAGRQVVGQTAAALVSILTLLNPWFLIRLTETIAETPLVFFVLLTLFFIFRRSRWAYLFAALASMVRYEGAALIGLAFLVDVFFAKDWKQRGAALGLAAVASVPLGLWLLGTKLMWDGGQSHYFKHYGLDREFEIGKYFSLIWSTSVGHLVSLPPGAGEGAQKAVRIISQAAVALACLAGVVHAMVRRNWKVLVLAGFALAYLVVHFGRGSAKTRYYAPLAWLVMLLAVYGLQIGWEVLRGGKIPRVGWVIGFIVVCVAGAAWVVKFTPLLPRLEPYSRRSAFLPYAGLIATAGVLAGPWLVRRKWPAKAVASAVCGFAVMCVMLFSNQLAVAQYVGNGERDIEFRRLVEWYEENAEGAILLTSLPDPLVMLSSVNRENFLHVREIAGEEPGAFTRDCLAAGVEYVEWDSRIGYARQNSYFKRWRYHRLDFLAQGRSVAVGDPENPGKTPAVYRFLRRIEGTPHRYIYLYRLEAGEGD